MNKLLSSIAGIGLMVSTAGVMASPITVGVATWDPEFDNGFFSADFNSGGTLSQFYTSNDNSAGKAVVGADVTGVIAASAVATGDFLTGVGSFTSFNSNLNFLCSGCELTYAFGGVKVSAVDQTAGTVSFDVGNSWLTVYSDKSADFDPADASSYMEAQDGNVFLNAEFSSLKLKIGTLITGSTEGLVNVLAGGLAEKNFDTNGEIGGADLKMSGTGNFDAGNPYYSNAGQLTAIGNSIPEPASLALLGLGLLGFGAASRRKAK